ncbi:xylose isomerase [Nitritalea halalkaliphila LW7]|uniref:Xylose isomerase n=1 Tax=Nitritalea halalkaliphila LW7 TaxID=1189621 RepID=I5C2C4_9BACT|nr:sugar phosphate isomerase/epimerase [Nitritalea halalkaliphila]EIM75976.1 xylose isomerase [Nitritalea halalkaliphila LW7]
MNQIWLMTSAFDRLQLQELLPLAQEIGVQGLDLCVFRRDGTRDDFVATHLEYAHFGPEDAAQLIEQFNAHRLRLSVGAFDNLIGGPEEVQRQNQNHLLRLIRIAHLLGGDENDVKVGTFVGYNHELGNTEGGFEKNLLAYKRVFTPIIRYAEDLGVTILYENCPMEGWRSAGHAHTFNNLSGVLAARQLMYYLIDSPNHGEIYDPSHDVWQHTDPCAVMRATDPKRLHRIHVKSTRRQADPFWGNMYPRHAIPADWSRALGLPDSTNPWERHHYEATLPGFGLGDDMDWRRFIQVVQEQGFSGPFEIENEAKLSKQTGNLAATVQGCRATVQNLAPLLYPLGESGYQYPVEAVAPLRQLRRKNIPLVQMQDL